MSQSRFVLHRAVWLFTACCMAGFLLESMESFFSLGYVQNRQGLLYGPFTPIYGAGALAFVLFYPLLKKRGWATVFAVTAIIGTVVEYIWSWGQELFFATVFWDYSQLPLHLNGRISVFFTVCWGILGAIFLKWIYPPFCAWMKMLPRQSRSLVTWVLLLLLLADITLSSFAFSRQKERQYAVSASSAIDVFLDSAYPDDWMRARFPNMKLCTD